MPIYHKLKKFTATALALIFLVSFAGILAPSAGAVSPTYSVSSAYKSSPYYTSLKDYTLTGDERYDLVSIAMTQYGYHEGNSDADMGGANVDGYKNFAEYNRMYGKLDNGEGNGTSYGYSWCASFVSWCLRQARVPTSTVETFVSCSRAVKNFRSKGQFKEASSGYIPQPGDIIFFVKPEDKAQGYVASHVGLVIGADDGYIYTIEGNTDNYCVCQKSYAFDNEKLVGFAVPNYKTIPGTVYDFVYKTDMKFPGTYTIKDNNLPVCRELTAYDKTIGYLSAGTVVEVKEVDLGWGLIDFGGSEGWIYLYHAEREQFTVTLDANGGLPSLAYHHKDVGIPLDLTPHAPKRDGYTLLGWSTQKNGALEYMANSAYIANADVTLYAVWRVDECTVEFVDYDGRSLYSNKYPYGSPIVIPAAPSRAADSQFTYEFSGWDKNVSPTADGDVTYRATYKATPIAVATTPPETTAAPVTDPPAPSTTAPESTTEAPTTTEEITEPPVVTDPETTEEVTTEAPLLIEDDYDLFGCGSALALPTILIIAVLPILCLKKKED